jgi:hypothetical protein
MNSKLHGLVAATHTPFDAEGQLNLSVVEAQAGWPPQITLKLPNGAYRRGNLSEFKDATAAQKKKKSGYIWEATDLGNFVVKYESEDKKITTVWKNIKTGGVADSVFELPAGYKKMDMPAMP